jgi:hypothetical protein
MHIRPCSVQRKVQAQTGNIDRGSQTVGALTVQWFQRMAVWPDSD